MTLPRVSFVLLAYRQEDFVRDAARAALDQDYANLQIVLSDDCSPDGTFDLLREEASRTARDAVVRQTPRNLGLIRHLYDAVRLADGELIVIAAGDDISKPQRARVLAERWQASGADALCSDWDVIDAEARVLRRGRPSGGSDLRFGRYFPDWNTVQIIGATAAYSRDVFDNVPPPPASVFAEDLYFTLMLAAWRRKVEWVQQSLVLYRAHDQAMTHTGPDPADGERRVQHEFWKVAELLDAFESDATSAGERWGRRSKVDWTAVREDAEFNRFRSGWIDAGLARRLSALQRFSAPSQRRWLLPRLFGLPVLKAIKTLRSPRGQRVRWS